MVPYHHAELIYGAAPEGKKTMITLEGVGHIRALRDDSVQKRVLELIK